MVDEEKLNRLKRKLEEYEEEKRRIAKLFNVRELIAEAGEIREKYVPEINAVVRYGMLTMGDLAELEQAKTDMEKGTRVLWLMLRKADPELKLEDVEKLPVDVATAVLTAIAGPLLQTGSKFSAGLKPAQKPS
jgi:hypothetical protein